MGGQNGHLPIQVLADQLTLYQPEGQIVPPHYYLPTQLYIAYYAPGRGKRAGGIFVIASTRKKWL